MNKVLLLDWDPHGEKYYLYFFLKENVLVDVWKHGRNTVDPCGEPGLVEQPRFCEYELLIFPTPYRFDKKIYGEIKKQGFDGRLMVEKMVSDSQESFDAFCRELEDLPGCRCAIMHQRLYTPVIESLSREGARVTWPIAYTAGMDCFQNILPNFLDEYYKCNRTLPTLRSVKKTENRYWFLFDGVELSVYPDESKRDKVRVDGVEVPWPDVFSFMPRAMERLFCDEEQDTGRSLAYERQMIEYIERARNMCEHE